ncbi:hypothetical protein PSE_0216 [Pseudovibrio sp. FO-BEG1]|uniref:hypothetical protein n=1 Tax=Pseudovibrio sp. (strain FO-BEG1) TaxID=911045 RepID=UPI000238BEE5|nr:hypothetical protein [Pseudovibrio sp. FO-BEG1]AEV34728.1 hypothetical protein PSE_0216 [Pseudovibrio sp. FO-BEG1]
MIYFVLFGVFLIALMIKTSVREFLKDIILFSWRYIGRIKWLRYYKGPIITFLTVATVVIGIVSEFNEETLIAWWVSIPLTVIFGALIIVVEFSVSSQTPSIESIYINKEKSLTTKYENLLFTERQESLKDTLREISADLQLDSGDRVSVYQLEVEEVNDNRYFVCAGRFSRHPENGRLKPDKKYAFDKGVLSKVWQSTDADGEYRDSKIPCSRRSKAAYYKYMDANYGLSRPDLDDIRMKSRDFYAFTLRDTKEEARAVFVYESVNENRFEEYSSDTLQDPVRIPGIIDKLDKLKLGSSRNHSEAGKVGF